ncbi:MAG: hypothetical protein KatS3mg002_1234 [Candidatus Woesearchaeota archaeon]|nr:MAG: hypothetical protein KatS3mg002_1234 [Candidatus Woesearchaeota archaeon]
MGIMFGMFIVKMNLQEGVFAPENYTFIVDTIAPYYYNVSAYPESPNIFCIKELHF